MGVSKSSLLDENKTIYIRGQADAVLQSFSKHYKCQHSVAFFSWLQDEVEQLKEGQTQLLKQKEPPQANESLYTEKVLCFDDTRKWKERFVVVRGDYSLECHDSPEAFAKGLPPRHRLLPAGGTVFTSEEKYMAVLDKCFPDPISAREETRAPVVVMQGKFPVFLRLPYLRDSYFCFHDEERRTAFISVLAECIRHQNHDFLRSATYEAHAFHRAVRFYREEKGHHESWEMLVGSEVSVLAKVVMDELLGCLEADLLPRLKGKKADRRRAWLAMVEAAYLLVQDQLQKGFTALKEECQEAAKQQEGLIRSQMDEIVGSRAFLTGKLRAMVTESAVKFCSENIQPYLASMLEEIMGPISSGFQEVRQLCESQMDRLCQDFQEVRSAEELRQALEQLGKAELLGCYKHVDILHEQLLNLRDRFRFSNSSCLVHNSQIDLQQLMQNAAYTFELLLQTALKDNPAKPASVMEKAKHRVLKQYDYDSSSVRKRIFQNALVDITLPALKQNLAPTCRSELQKFEQYIFADYANFIQVENVYEDILQQILEGEVIKVVKEAANLKKHNLFMDSSDPRFVSQASLGDGQIPQESTLESAAKVSECPALGNGLSNTLEKSESSTVPEEGKKAKVEMTEPTETEKDTPTLLESGIMEKDKMADSAETGKVELDNKAQSAEDHGDEGDAASGNIAARDSRYQTDMMEKVEMMGMSERHWGNMMDDTPPPDQITEEVMDEAAGVVKGDEEAVHAEASTLQNVFHPPCSITRSTDLIVDINRRLAAGVPGGRQQLVSEEICSECSVDVIKDTDLVTSCPDPNADALATAACSQKDDKSMKTVAVSADAMTEVTKHNALTFDPAEHAEDPQRSDSTSESTKSQGCQYLGLSGEAEPMEYFAQKANNDCSAPSCIDPTTEPERTLGTAAPDLVKESQETPVEMNEVKELVWRKPDESAT